MRKVAVTRVLPPLVLAVAGVVVATAWSSTTAQAAGFALLGVACVIAVSFAFLEIGLSEDRERAQTERPAGGTADGPAAGTDRRRRRWPRARERRRDHG